MNENLNTDQAPTISHSSSPGGVRWLLRAAGTRLRFVAVFVAVFAIIGGWETIRTHWGALTQKKAGEKAVSGDTEYFCPMDPGVLSDWPSKCPVCNMTLVRKKRGEAVPLPNGVMARMQITPYRLMLGGIQTSPAEYAALARSFSLSGIVAESTKERALIQLTLFAPERPWFHEAQAAEVVELEQTPIGPLDARVLKVPGSVDPRGLGQMVVECRSPASPLPAGASVKVRLTTPVDAIEPFRSMPTQPPAIAKDEPRKLYTCMDHPDMLATAPGKCPRDQQPLMARGLLANQRVRWWCPMHPAVTADREGAKCQECGGMTLLPRVISYRPPGKVLAVPGSAIVEVGSQALVYLDKGAGMFDARMVTIGPVCGGMTPVVAGLEPGERVVSQSAFLLDAEARLDPNLATAYFGAGSRPGGATGTSLVATAGGPEWSAGMSAADRSAAVAQADCPVTGKPLGSMGVPLKVSVAGRPVFLCCDGCSGAMETNPGKYMARLKKPVATEKSP